MSNQSNPPAFSPSPASPASPPNSDCSSSDGSSDEISFTSNTTEGQHGDLTCQPTRDNEVCRQSQRPGQPGEVIAVTDAADPQRAISEPSQINQGSAWARYTKLAVGSVLVSLCGLALLPLMLSIVEPYLSTAIRHRTDRPVAQLCYHVPLVCTILCATDQSFNTFTAACRAQHLSHGSQFAANYNEAYTSFSQALAGGNVPPWVAENPPCRKI